MLHGAIKPGMVSSGVIMLHENARCVWSPRDFPLFGPLKKLEKTTIPLYANIMDVT